MQASAFSGTKLPMHLAPEAERWWVLNTTRSCPLPSLPTTVTSHFFQPWEPDAVRSAGPALAPPPAWVPAEQVRLK
jgi:hypothetical protein